MRKLRLCDAIDMIRNIESVLGPVGYHVALRGSVLINGESDNDLDIVIYPHNSTNFNEVVRVSTMNALGMKLVRTSKQSHDHWRNKGSTDKKLIEIWNWNGVVVDVLLVVDDSLA